MEAQKMIEINNLTKIYNLYEKPVDRLKEALSPTKKCYHKSHYALKDISLTINKGESIGIMGINGSGKSTILKIITGVLNPTSGTVKTYGKISALLELGAGFNPEYTGIENIYLNGTMMGYTKEEMDGRVQAIVDFADIGDFINQPVKTYSSGMFARLAFAVSINVDPEILIVDEALAVGDIRFQMKCIDKMKELKEKGTTILFVSHATEQIKRFCTRGIWLKHGVVEKDGESSEVVDMYENFMKYGDKVITETKEDEEIQQAPSEDVVAFIRKVNIEKNTFRTFEEFKVGVEYEICEEKIDAFLLGAAIYSKDRKEYIFGPNTYLDKTEIPNTKGRHYVEYVIPKLTLMSGDYCVDVGIFTDEGILNFDYKMGVIEFSVVNNYFSEGRVYIDHSWNVVK